jgi:hypothetical protein
VWLVIIGAEFVHGTMRNLLLAPRIGDFRARQWSVLTGSILIVAVACVFVRWMEARSTRALLLVGVEWLVLTVLFEQGAGHYVFGRSWESLASDYDLLHGGVLPLGLAVLTFAPLIAAKLRGVKTG